MEVSLELLLLAQTHHIGGISSGPRLGAMYGLRVISHVDDWRSKLVFAIVHPDPGRRKSNGVFRIVGGMSSI